MRYVGLLIAFGLAACYSGPLDVRRAGDMVNVGPGEGSLLISAAVEGRCATGPSDDFFRFYRGSGDVPVDNFTPDRNCRNELALFRQNHALFFAHPSWSPQPGDHIQSEIADSEDLEVVIRVIPDDDDQQLEKDLTELRIGADVCRAHYLFNTMSCGRIVTMRLGKLKSTKDLNLAQAGCEAADKIKKAYGFTPGALNVYYTIGSGYNGFHCPSANDFILISRTVATNETLAHEIGHAMELRDYSLDMQNIMFSGHPIRAQLTLGQCFRAAVNPLSRGFQQRIQLSHDCTDTNGTRTCPSEGWPDATAKFMPEMPRAWRYLNLEELTRDDLGRLTSQDRAALIAFDDLKREIQSSDADEELENFINSTYDTLRLYSDSRKQKDAPLNIEKAVYRSLYVGSSITRWDVRIAMALNTLKNSMPVAAEALRRFMSTVTPEARKQLNALNIR